MDSSTEFDDIRPHQVNLFTQLFQRPESFLVGTFALLILIGTAFLSLPTAQQKPISLLDCFFTATSAVCVTGLIVVDTGTDYTFFGQCVILVLIQLGGLGIMTYGALVLQLTGHKLSFRSQAALHDVFYQRGAAGKLQRNLKWIVVLTFTIEAIGAVLLYVFLPDRFIDGDAIFVAIFHAISGYCNAGFSTFSDSLIGLREETGVMATISCLIIIGGLGYSVLLELVTRGWSKIERRRMPLTWSLHTRVVLLTSLALILLGAAVMLLLGLTHEPDHWSQRLSAALFQSITARTAGFNTVPIGAVPTASLLILCILMFVGGSPGSCAGGIKTTSLAIWVARLKARLVQQEDVTLGNRRIPVALVRRVGLLLGVASLHNLIGIFILSITELPHARFGLQDILFEQISSFGTVGLSTGITPYLSSMGKVWIVFSMFLGRLGPLTLALAVLHRKPALVRLPEERLMIG